MEESKLKFLVINNFSQFASKDVWDGFLAVLRKDLKYEVLAYPIDQLQAFFSNDMIQHHILSTAVSTRNKFTHIIFIGSTFLQSWVIESIHQCGVKTCYWSLEDPHAFDQNSRFMGLASYYFTNEKAIAKKFNGEYEEDRNVNGVIEKIKRKAFYLPTAGAHTVCIPPVIPLHQMHEEDIPLFDSDVVFCGNIYPNRQKILEAILPGLEENGIKFGFMGITNQMVEEDDNKSPIRNYIKGHLEGVVDHRYFIMAYGYAKFVINIESDPLYEYSEQFSTNRNEQIIGESLNPRAYEIALCGGGLQLIDNKRQEIFQKGILEPGVHCVVYDSPEDMVEKILYYTKHEDERLKIVKAAYEHALNHHTYLCRAKRMIDIINWEEDRKSDVIQPALDALFSGSKIKAKEV